MTYSLTSPDAVMLGTRIPETHRVEGLEYGRHLSGTGWSGYYVRPEGVEHWGVARQTPAGDELHDTDAETVEAIREEIVEVHEAIQDATEQGFTSLELGGVEYTWTITPPEIEVIGLGAEDWTTDNDREWQRYGTVLVRIGGIEYEVGAAIGVPEHLIGTAKAAGGDTHTPYLAAWYEYPGDWSSATRTDGGPRGIPARLEWDVIGAIDSDVHRLWREHEEARRADISE